jgi:hypothetical protein
MGFEEGTKGHGPLLASAIMFMSTTLIFTHSDTSCEKKKDGPTINIKRPHQYLIMTNSQLMKIIKRIYNWRSTLYKKRNPWFSNPLSVSISNQQITHRQRKNRNIFSTEGLNSPYQVAAEIVHIEMEYSE